MDDDKFGEEVAVEAALTELEDVEAAMAVVVPEFAVDGKAVGGATGPVVTLAFVLVVTAVVWVVVCFLAVEPELLLELATVLTLPDAPPPVDPEPAFEPDCPEDPPPPP